MSKSIPVLLALVALLAAPAVTAQALPAATLTLSLSGLPSNVTSNGTLLALPFEVQAKVMSTGACASAPTGASPAYTVSLAAVVKNGTSKNTTVSVTPASFTVQGPNLLQTGSVTRVVSGTLLVDPGEYSTDSLAALVTLTASSPGGNPGCQGAMATPAATTSSDVATTFYPVTGYGTSSPSGGAELPFPGAPILLIALAAVVVALRRK